ncbi:hypothetical protein D3C72_623690 [compost metagenome]
MVAADKHHRHIGPFAVVEGVAQGFGLRPVNRTHAGNAQHVAVFGLAVCTPVAQAFLQFVEADDFVFHVRRDHFQSAENRVGMAVDQAGHQRFAFEIDDLGAGFDQGFDLRVGADLQHFAVLYGEGLRLGLCAVGSENLTVEQDQISSGHGFHRGKTYSDYQQTRDESFH